MREFRLALEIWHPPHFHLPDPPFPLAPAWRPILLNPEVHRYTTPGPSPTPTPRPEYAIDLSPAIATNILPDEHAHMLVAKVTETGAGVAGARVTLVTDEGSFEASGSGSKTTIS